MEAREDSRVHTQGFESVDVRFDKCFEMSFLHRLTWAVFQQLPRIQSNKKRFENVQKEDVSVRLASSIP